MRGKFLSGLLLVAVALAMAPLLGQRGKPSQRPPWVLESRNTVSLELPAAVRDAVRWDGIDPAAPIGASGDLNDDGVPDYLLKGTSSVCGTGGCPYGIVDGKSAQAIGSAFGNPLVVRAHKTNGFYDIDVYSSGSVSSGAFVSHIFDGRQYVQRSVRQLAGREVTSLFATLNKIPRWRPE